MSLLQLSNVTLMLPPVAVLQVCLFPHPDLLI
jgi:hypothetical protein